MQLQQEAANQAVHSLVLKTKSHTGSPWPFRVSKELSKVVTLYVKHSYTAQLSTTHVCSWRLGTYLHWACVQPTKPLESTVWWCLCQVRQRISRIQDCLSQFSTYLAVLLSGTLALVKMLVDYGRNFKWHKVRTYNSAIFLMSAFLMREVYKDR